MASQDLRKRGSDTMPARKGTIPDLGGGETGLGKEPHPRGEVKHGFLVQLLRMMALATWFAGTSVATCATQFIGAPLYWINKDYYYAYMALTKQSFGIVLTTVTNWFSPTTIRISWDDDMSSLFKISATGLLETTFPERLILIANHQVYTDWLYQWWIAYTSRMHGHIYIVLREDLKYIPVLGQGMMFYGFIFMARKWISDKPRLQHRLAKLRARHSGPMSGTGSQGGLDPMWLLLFPEGTNLSANTRRKNHIYAEKNNIPEPRHQLLPRSTGLHFCLEQLAGSVDWIYDCTVAYEGTPRDGYAQDYFTIRSIYFQGRPPASVSMHWRRFEISKIPMENAEVFEKWLMARWMEKDDLLEEFYNTGSFPAAKRKAAPGKLDKCVETQVKLRSPLEIVQIFMVLMTLALVLKVMEQLIGIVTATMGTKS